MKPTLVILLIVLSRIGTQVARGQFEPGIESDRIFLFRFFKYFQYVTYELSGECVAVARHFWMHRKDEVWARQGKWR